MKKKQDKKDGAEKLGVDFGNTIVGILKGSGSAKRPGKDEITGSIRVLRRLVEERFGTEAVYIISKVSPGGKEKVLKWMEENDFFRRTGIVRERVIFCAERHEKGPIAQGLGISHFIDDRPEVLAHMPYLAQGLLFRADEGEYAQFEPRLTNVLRVNGWDEIERILL